MEVKVRDKVLVGDYGCLQCNDFDSKHVVIEVRGFRINLCEKCAKELTQKIEEAIKDGN